MLESLPVALGSALRGARPGIKKLMVNRADFLSAPATLEVSSPAFADGAPIPTRFTADGAKVSPPIRWSGVPLATQALVMVMEDADSPSPLPLVHVIASGLPPADGGLLEGDLSSEHPAPVLGRNSYLQAGYLPPDPPPGHGPHRYFIQLFALDDMPELDGSTGRRALITALRGHVLAKGFLMGTYERRG